MLDTKDFTFFESQNNFDFRVFFTKIAGHWLWFLISLIVAFTIAYQVNIRKQKIYSIATTVSYKEENNPFFSANTSLVFNWGGTSDQVQNIMSTLKSRSHNEMVVRELDYYIQYLRQGKYNLEDAYGEVPFRLIVDKNKPQLLGNFINIKFINANQYKLSINFEQPSVQLLNYNTEETSNTNVTVGEFNRIFKVGEQVSLPFLDWKLELNSNPGYYENSSHMVRLDDFNSVVNNYRQITVESDAKAASILVLSMQGTNKARMVDYLNGTVKTLINRQLQLKNQFASNTIAFIDSTLIAMESQLKDTENELKAFSKGKNLFELEDGNSKVSDKLSDLDLERDNINRKMNYYNTLKSYLQNSTDYSKLPAPSVAGIDDPNIISNVTKLTLLSAERSEMSYSLKNDKRFKDFDVQMDALKKVLLENIAAAKTSIQYDLNFINKKIAVAEDNIRRLPEQQQALVKINRKYDLNKNVYNSFLEKRGEANIVRASNLSDIQFIDPAKDIGGGLIGPKTSVNYVLALFLGILCPLVLVFAKTLIDNSIKNIDDITTKTKIPILGVIGKNKSNTKSNLAVYERPKSALAEGFRAIRSSLQFLYKKQQAGTKTLMITSSISGEGKTFCTINIATVFALSEKKTVIVGLDLRKPRIYQDFKIENNFGVVNYLIGQKSIEEIIQTTPISFLDFIPAGPIPPNPSELIMGESMGEMIKELKSKYDYIILDTPPVGLVSDAFELTQFCDVTLYVVRQNFTKKEMLTLVNNKNKTGELKNVSIVFNGFENKAKYGYTYGYGYGYGYGNYSNGYHESEVSDNFFMKIIKTAKNKFIKK
jgi:polysaccharide biosynthesis transport protein